MYSIKDVIIDTLQGNADKVSKEVKDTRLKICLSCPNSTKISRQCGICGCFLDMKTLYTKSECPDNPPRWNEE
jgi:hypothetical protein